MAEGGHATRSFAHTPSANLTDRGHNGGLQAMAIIEPHCATNVNSPPPQPSAQHTQKGWIAQFQSLPLTRKLELLSIPFLIPFLVPLLIIVIPLTLAIAIIGETIVVAVMFAPYIVLGTLIHYGQRETPPGTVCDARVISCGFVGNADYYGLGVRTGLYFQWTASVLANQLVPQDRRGLTTSTLGVGWAFFMATLVLIFKHVCTFTAEMIVFLYVFWGGTILVLLRALKEEEYDDPIKSDNEHYPGMTWFTTVVIGSMWMISDWFWFRIAAVGEIDFQSTPCGTSFFFIGHVGPEHLKLTSGFTASLAIWTQLSFLLVMISKELLGGRFHLVAVCLQYSTIFGVIDGVLALTSETFGTILRKIRRPMMSCMAQCLHLTDRLLPSLPAWISSYTQKIRHITGKRRSRYIGELYVSTFLT